MDIIFVEPEETDQTVQMRRLRLSAVWGAVLPPVKYSFLH